MTTTRQTIYYCKDMGYVHFEGRLHAVCMRETFRGALFAPEAHWIVLHTKKGVRIIVESEPMNLWGHFFWHYAAAARVCKRIVCVQRWVRKRHARTLACVLAMAWHPRLGADAPIRCLPEHLLSLLFLALDAPILLLS